MNERRNGGKVTFTIHNSDVMDGFKSIPNNSVVNGSIGLIHNH